MGFSGFNDKTEEEWLREIVEGCKDIPDYVAFKEKGVHKVKNPKPYVAFEEQIQGGQPFPTPSGKIEIYSQTLAALEDPALPPIPKYIETWENHNDPLAKKYPLQLITTHYWRRTHSKFDNIPWLRELEAQAVLINREDALVLYRDQPWQYRSGTDGGRSTRHDIPRYGLTVFLRSRSCIESNY